MRADRLLTLLRLLHANGRMSSKSLAERLEVSERTIHRDMEALSAAGIPVYAHRGHLGGWSLPEGYRNRLTGMTANEISALLMLQTSGIVKDLGLEESASSAIGKLRSALPPAAHQDAEFARQRIHIDGAGWRDPAAFGEAESAGRSMLAIVQEAVWAERKLLIRYAGAAEPRLVCPLGLVAKSQVWYVMTLSETDGGEPRTFRVSRIDEARVTGEPFERPEGFDLAASWTASVQRFRSNLPRYEAVVSIANDRFDAFRRERFVSVREYRTDAAAGRVRAEVTFDTLESACAILLGYGRHAEALAPDELRGAVIREVGLIAALYRD
ncbi:MAG: WYL domain-containing protein [Cohnella sp.]|nr:WYL domain-containing protein [Cohnella sp.]